jgi:leucyl aminopeptidase
LALTQNLISPAAYKQGDVVIALNGTSIEVVHTDAEGRMVLADTLILASRTKPVGIIDYATLTGTCVYALGTRYSGVFTNRRQLLLRHHGCRRGFWRTDMAFPCRSRL